MAKNERDLIAVKVPRELTEAVDAICQEKGWTRAKVVIEALRDYFALPEAK